MELAEEDRDGVVVVRVIGKRIDASKAPVVKETLTRRIEAGPKKLVLDLTLVEFIDSIGLGALVSCLKRSGGEGRLAIVGVQGADARLFKLTRLDRVFPLYANLDDALRS